eukprot:2776704-Amphidinium_carterae.1
MQLVRDLRCCKIWLDLEWREREANRSADQLTTELSDGFNDNLRVASVFSDVYLSVDFSMSYQTFR